jgi:hypothetical protein
MSPDIGHVVASQAMFRLATSALPCAPVRPEPRRRQHAVTRRLLGALTGRARA